MRKPISFRVFGFCIATNLILVPLALAQDKPDAKSPRPIYVMDIEGTNLRPLVQEETDYDMQGTPAWSPDGKKIGFDAWRSKFDDNYSKTHVIITDADGSNWTDLGDGAMPSFSRDGKRICYSRYGDARGVWIANHDGTDKVLINAGGWSARWSPDGKWIAYTVGGNIMLFDPEKMEDVKLLFTDGQEKRYRSIYWSFDWSPDSKQIAFKGRLRETPEGGDAETYEVAVVSVDGSEGLLVACEEESGNQVSWHPNGNQIMFALHDKELKKKRLFTANPYMPTDPEPLDPQPDFERIEGAAWSPDGKRLLMMGQR